MKPTRAIVVGGTSGIGLELVRALLADGVRVAAVGRNFESLEGSEATLFPLDIQQTTDIPQAFESLTAAMGGLDLLIYCAGVMNPVRIDEFDTQKDQEMIAVNVTGAVAWMNLAATHFLRTKQGCLVAIGSVAGDRGRQGQPVYNASKAFLHAYTESLRNRLARHGVSVVTIKPGPTRTPMTAHHDQKGMMDPVIAARRIINKVGRNGEFYLSPTHQLIGFIFRHIPGRLMRRIQV